MRPRRTAEICKEEFSRAYEIVMNDMYVDDCFSGTCSAENIKGITDELSIVLRKGVKKSCHQNFI